MYFRHRTQDPLLVDLHLETAVLLQPRGQHLHPKGSPPLPALHLISAPLLHSPVLALPLPSLAVASSPCPRLRLCGAPEYESDARGLEIPSHAPTSVSESAPKNRHSPAPLAQLYAEALSPQHPS